MVAATGQDHGKTGSSRDRVASVSENFVAFSFSVLSSVNHHHARACVRVCTPRMVFEMDHLSAWHRTPRPKLFKKTAVRACTRGRLLSDAKRPSEDDVREAFLYTVYSILYENGERILKDTNSPSLQPVCGRLLPWFLLICKLAVQKF